MQEIVEKAFRPSLHREAPLRLKGRTLPTPSDVLTGEAWLRRLEGRLGRKLHERARKLAMWPWAEDRQEYD